MAASEYSLDVAPHAPHNLPRRGSSSHHSSRCLVTPQQRQNRKTGSMALLGSLPAPRLAPTPQPVASSVNTLAAPSGRATTAPPYGKRKGGAFIPRKPSDFGDGGAYPECHVAQYPLEMGRAGGAGTTGGQSGAIVPVSVDAEGRVDYGAIVKQGLNANKTIATTHNALVPKLHTVKDEVGNPLSSHREPSSRRLVSAWYDGVRTAVLERNTDATASVHFAGPRPAG